jgi:hypothetical protein
MISEFIHQMAWLQMKSLRSSSKATAQFQRNLFIQMALMLSEFLRCQQKHLDFGMQGGQTV